MDIIYKYFQFIIASAAVFAICLKLFFWIRVKFKRMEDIHEMIQKIFKELTPNSGSSIKDKILKIESELDEQSKCIEKITRRQLWILDNESKLIFETDDKGKFLWVNKTFKDVASRELSFFVGHGWKNVIHDEDRERVIEKFVSCIKDGILYEDEFRIMDSEYKVYNVKCVANKSDKHGYMGTITLL